MLPLLGVAQVMCYVTALEEIPLPASAAIYVTELTKVIEGKSVNPEGLIRLWEPEFRLMTWWQGKQALIVDPAQRASVVADLEIFIIIGAAAFFGITCALLAACLIPSMRSTISKQLKGAASAYRWNGLINTIRIAHLKLALAAQTQLHLALIGSAYLSLSGLMAGVLLAVIIIGTIIAATMVVKRNRADLDA